MIRALKHLLFLEAVWIKGERALGVKLPAWPRGGQFPKVLWHDRRGPLLRAVPWAGSWAAPVGNSPSSPLLALGWGWSTRQTPPLGSAAPLCGAEGGGRWRLSGQVWFCPCPPLPRPALALGKAVQITARPRPSTSLAGPWIPSVNLTGAAEQAKALKIDVSSCRWLVLIN